MVSFAAPVGAMPPPPTPITKRPTMGLKRDSSYLDTDDEAGLSVTTKRLRFNPDVEIREYGLEGDKSEALVREEVRSAIDKHLATADHRDDTPYIKLLDFFGRDPADGDAPSTKLLKKYIDAISGRIAVLGECSKLVISILDLSWLGRDDEFVRMYEKFLILLGSTYSKFVSPILERLVSHFERLPASMGRLPYEDPVSRTDMFARLHATIEHIVERIPMASKVLLSQFGRQFPDDLAKTKSYLQYQRHILDIARYSSEVLQGGVIELIVRRLVNIDVQIQRDIEELEDDAEEQLLQKQRQRGDALGGADEDDDSDDDSDSESEITVTEEEQRLQNLRLKVANMDGTQVILFEYYHSRFPTHLRPEDNDAYNGLWSLFTSFIMTHRCRHAQFLLFHFAQTSPAYAANFINRCIQITSNKTAAPNLRLTACAYVASFVARGSHVSSSLIRSTFMQLADLLENLRRTSEPQCMGPDRKMYGMYYAIAQALLYIFCFRWRDLVVREPGDMIEEDILAEGRDLAWFPGVKETLHRNVHSVLNPLKVCSPHIVGEFAKIANHLRFLYVFSLLERNKRIRLGQVPSYFKLGGTIDIGRRETAFDRKTGEAHHQLEAYFPFDPYHLPQSKKWIEGEFNAWQLPRGMKQDDDEEEEDESDEEEEEHESDEESLPGDLAVQPPVSSGILAMSGN
ncbi:RNA polymerase I-specific transcription initiation factor rrn3 [Pseudocercospora fuligena]|uniref:RNA polymerase I-specific transcription initiation factor rrn3 n=1 Tax=Pseudocercospora fuligena TaxID=685502 RepID=A0A8H6VF25_9PEZI|nr:RNA polymerase I-specific transcription initiation factor rrn3 [Pseudocercospora fuligena]